MRVGVEVGGTFTDLVSVDGDRIILAKVPSTPHSPDIGVLDALEGAGLDLQGVSDFVHGSTVATNALLERKGAKVAFITTRGFRDILFLQRHDRRNIYDLAYQKPVPVVERKDCFEVEERIDSSGGIVTPLDVAEAVAGLVPALRKGGYQAVAICLLSAYVNAEHERALFAALQAALPGLFITCSADVSREFREFERASTTTLAAYVQPVIDAYLEKMKEKMTGRGFASLFSVMQSNGGRLPIEGMRRNAISAIFSGPAAGVVGASRQAARSEVRNLITFDMGGTSTDVCLVTDGVPGISPDTEIDGLPVRTPVLDIATIGAGGGSLVWVDDGGMLRVGPRSSGAMPGPACYGRGGTQPTITDAHVIRGTIRPEAFLGGAMKIYPEKAFAAFEPIAAQLGMTVLEAAAAALQLGVANIVRAIQLISTEKGYDPRDYALVPYGGAGPLMAVEVAKDLDLNMVLIPPNPGVISAFGLIASDFSKIYALSRRQPLDETAPDAIRAVYGELYGEAEAEFSGFGLRDNLSVKFVADMRFVGQAFEIAVDIDPAQIDSLGERDLIAAFAAAHQRIYLHGAAADQEVEIVSYRLEIIHALEKLPTLTERPITDRPAHSKSMMQDNTGRYEIDVHLASALEVGHPYPGPALVEGYSSTTLIPKGWIVTRQGNDNLLVKKA